MLTGGATFVVMTPDGEQREHTLRAFNTLGRHPDQTIQILDRVVSKEHALVTAADGDYWLQDIGSRNGTFVNGVQINGERDSKTATRSVWGALVYSLSPTTPPRLFGNYPATSQFMRSQLKQPHARASSTRCSAERVFAEADIVDEQTVRADYEKLRILFELNKAIGSEMTKLEILDRILEKAFEFSGADRGVILLLNADGEPEPRAYKNRRGSEEQNRNVQNDHQGRSRTAPRGFV